MAYNQDLADTVYEQRARMYHELVSHTMLIEEIRDLVKEMLDIADHNAHTCSASSSRA